MYLLLHFSDSLFSHVLQECAKYLEVDLIDSKAITKSKRKYFLCWHPYGVQLKFFLFLFYFFTLLMSVFILVTQDILSLFLSSTYMSTYNLYAGIITNRVAAISNFQMFPLRLESWTRQWHHPLRKVKAHVLMIQINHWASFFVPTSDPHPCNFWHLCSVCKRTT